MAFRNAYIYIENKSPYPVTIYVGVTIATNIGGSGCGLYAYGKYQDLGVHQYTIQPYGNVTDWWYFDDSSMGGYPYYLIAKVWLNYSNGQLSNCVSGCAVKVYSGYSQQMC